MFSSALVRLLLMQKLIHLFHRKFDGKVACGPRKKPLDLGGNPGHILLWLGLWLGGGGVRPYCAWEDELAGVCLTVTVLSRQRSWRRYSLY